MGIYSEYWSRVMSGKQKWILTGSAGLNQTCLVQGRLSHRRNRNHHPERVLGTVRSVQQIILTQDRVRSRLLLFAYFVQDGTVPIGMKWEPPIANARLNGVVVVGLVMVLGAI